MSYAPGALVTVRGREWTVLPESTDELLMLRPLDGLDDEIAGVYLPLEGADVRPACFGLPTVAEPGDHRSARLLRDAVRLGFRSGAGPFRSFGRIAVEPRAYQLVPLLMALRQNPVRLLIADDVGVGKTIEACLIARELLDRGEIQRFVVLCPPHLAEQWASELREKFNLEAEALLTSTIRRLERRCVGDQSVFDVYPVLVVSTDYIKSNAHRERFAVKCPELVIVDEAHTCAFGATKRGGRHQRFELVERLAKDRDRHVILVTATPHSGDAEAFRSLLGFLKPELGHLPEDLSGDSRRSDRERLAEHLIQRRRGDVERFPMEGTKFPTREPEAYSYHLSVEGLRFFQHVMTFIRETVPGGEERSRQQRVRWWSALALLRAMASSPAAAAATLRNRARVVEARDADDADTIGEQTVLDMGDDAELDLSDVTPGADAEDDDEENVGSTRRRLQELAREADPLKGDGDAKLVKAVSLVKKLLEDGFHPIVFCRFIATSEYVAFELRRRLKNADVVEVNGMLPPEDREGRVLEAQQLPNRVLVSTDCLSEGINLQAGFDAVLHYDLPWNPTRLEQREGRVDRFGQASPVVKTLTYHGVDNGIDGIVLDVLLTKHLKIRKALGVSVPVPAQTGDVLEAILNGLVARKGDKAEQMSFLHELDANDASYIGQRDEFHALWDREAKRHEASRTLFAHRTIKEKDVEQELKATQAALGRGVDVERFVETALKACNVPVTSNGSLTADLGAPDVPPSLRDAVGYEGPLKGAFVLPVPSDVVYLHRTHPVVEGLASYVMNTALDPLAQGVARRVGVLSTAAVAIRTTALLVRYRFHLISRAKGAQARKLLAEDAALLAFEGHPQEARWLPPEQADRLLTALPGANVNPDLARHYLEQVLTDYSTALEPSVRQAAQKRGLEVLESHRRVREAAKLTGLQLDVEPVLPVDVLGVYVYLPVGGGLV